MPTWVDPFYLGYRNFHEGEASFGMENGWKGH